MEFSRSAERSAQGNSGKMSSRIGVEKASSSIAVKRTYDIKDCIARNCDFSSMIHSTTIFHSVYFPPQWRSQCLRIFLAPHIYAHRDELRDSFALHFKQRWSLSSSFYLFSYFFFFSLYFSCHFIFQSLHYLFSYFSSLFFYFFLIILPFFIFSVLILFSYFPFFFALEPFVTLLLDVLKLFQHFAILLHASFKVLSQNRVTLLLGRTTSAGGNYRRARACVCVGANLMTRVR